MADPKETIRLVLPSSSNDSFKVYVNQVNHANSYANNIFANNLTVDTLTIAGEAGGAGGGGSTVLVNTANGAVSYNTNTNSKSNGAVVNIIFEENPGMTGHILDNTFSINISANNLIKDPSGTYLSVGDTIEFQSVISNLRLISDGEHWYLSGDNTMANVAAGNTYVTSTFVSNSYAGSTFSSNTYLQDQLDSKATNTYVNSTFTSNTYVNSTFTSNTYVNSTFTSNTYVDGRFTSNTYVDGRFTSNTYVDGRFTSNTFLVATFTTNNYIQSYVSSEVASLVDSAPATLDTLNELAAALGDDPNFATTVSTQIGIRATNTYLTSTFTSNNYIEDKYTANTYAQDAFDPAGTAVAMAIALG